MAKVSFSISDDLLRDIDVYTKANYMTRSGFISMCCYQYLQASEAMRLYESMVSSLQSLAESAKDGSVDPEALKELEKFKALADLLISSGKFKA